MAGFSDLTSGSYDDRRAAEQARLDKERKLAEAEESAVQEALMRNRAEKAVANAALADEVGTAPPDVLADLEGRGAFRDPTEQRMLAANKPKKLEREMRQQKESLGLSPAANAAPEAPFSEGKLANPKVPGQDRFFTNINATPKGGVEGSFNEIDIDDTGTGIFAGDGEGRKRPDLERRFAATQDILDTTPQSHESVVTRVMQELPKLEKLDPVRARAKVLEGLERGHYSAPEAVAMVGKVEERATEREAIESAKLYNVEREKLFNIGHESGAPVALTILEKKIADPDLTEVEAKVYMKLQHELQVAASKYKVGTAARAQPNALPPAPTGSRKMKTLKAYADYYPATVMNPEGRKASPEQEVEAQVAEATEAFTEPVADLAPPAPTVHSLAAKSGAPTQQPEASIDDLTAQRGATMAQWAGPIVGGILGGPAGAAAGGALGSVAGDLMVGEDVDFGQAAMAGGFGLVGGAAVGKIAGPVVKAASKTLGKGKGALATTTDLLKWMTKGAPEAGKYVRPASVVDELLKAGGAKTPQVLDELLAAVKAGRVKTPEQAKEIFKRLATERAPQTQGPSPFGSGPRSSSPLGDRVG